jgi:hypothetical protein
LSIFAVGMPVARHLPHRAGRAVFSRFAGFLDYTRLRDGCMMSLYNRFAIALSEVGSHYSSSTLAGMSFLCGLRTSVSAFPMYVAFPRFEYYA